MTVDLSKYVQPVLVDNRRWRAEVPDYTQYFHGVAEELSRLPRQGNVVVDPGIVETTACAVCDSDAGSQLLVKYGFEYVQCDVCTHIYLKNRLIEDRIIKNYKDSELDDITHKIEQHDNPRDYTSRLYAKYTSLLSDLGITKGRLIDVGCGAGNFLRYCSSHTDYELYALELSEKVHADLESIVGKERLCKERIEDAQFGSLKFDVITMWGVLEHPIDPFRALKASSTMLADDGCILALVPNLHSRAFKILGVNTPTLNPRVHLHMFTRASFERMADRAGLAVESLFCELPVIDLMYDYIRYDADLVADIIRKYESYYFVYLLRKR